ncbi:glycerol-3-phosphate dehydrogenase/oxidase [Thalassolituus sp.]|uniref:glycerol-3-phosphate dehydrogenase/oxidase n=1 Tax=Thalassolituus sp. TaxID=2030822 RepID=UPI002A833E04|nr:glycerol-3-phosphate dehydrogenase/oxidase [Thalassolituus sp.]
MKQCENTSDLWDVRRSTNIAARLSTYAQTWDLVIAGGGITGAGIAREAARRGLRVLLVERQDFAWGTSSRSSKMVHGGLRYIAQGDIKTTLHSVRERERLMREAPGLVDQMPYIMPHYKGRFPGPKIFGLLLMVYDFLAGKRYRKFHNATELSKMLPGLATEGLLGGTEFADAVTDDSRLVMRVLHEAIRDGAEVINYAAVAGVERIDGKVSAVHITDELTGERITLSTNAVVNATGAWADVLRAQEGEQAQIRPARGSHIVLSAEKLPVPVSLTVLHPQDQRPIFVYPWEGRTVVGTTDLDHPDTSNTEASMTQQELDYLLALLAHQYPDAHITSNDVISSWAGVRPLVSSGALNPSKEKRDHSIWDDQGLVTVSGGKLTTFRLIALDVLDTAKTYLPDMPNQDDDAAVLAPADTSHPSFDGLTQQQQRRLSGHYGSDLNQLLAEAGLDELSEIPGSCALWAELRWATAHESVVHLDDLLLRRTRIGLLVEEGGMIFEDRIRAICQPLLAWSDVQWQQEALRYREIWRQHYSLPVAETSDTAQPTLVRTA